MVFNILISNTDDHLRNHGYLRDPAGWRLAPAYDLNPMPVDVKPRHHALTLNETDDASSIDTAYSVASYFGIKMPEAKRSEEHTSELQSLMRISYAVFCL